MQANNKPIGQCSLIEMPHQPICEVLDFLNQQSPTMRESMGHAIALACYLELSK